MPCSLADKTFNLMKTGLAEGDAAGARGRTGWAPRYLLPARFVIEHPPFLPDFPNGYYRIDPTLDVDDAPASIHPSVFTRVLPAQTVDVYPRPSPA